MRLIIWTPKIFSIILEILAKRFVPAQRGSSVEKIEKSHAVSKTDD